VVSGQDHGKQRPIGMIRDAHPSLAGIAMSRHLARNIYHLMKGAARRTTVDDLRKQGRRSVSVLNFKDIQDLIEKAVENTLKRRGLKLNGPGIQEQVKLEFLALIRERDMLQATVEQLLDEKKKLSRNRDKLGKALAVATDEYKSAQEADHDDEEAAELDALGARVESSLRELLDGTDKQLEDRAVDLVHQAFSEQRGVAVEKAKRNQGERVQRIQRRMSRLKAKLQETEEMLARARADGVVEGVPGQPVDSGLDASDPTFETKKELLSEIFRLNVELREVLDKD